MGASGCWAALTNRAQDMTFKSEGPEFGVFMTRTSKRSNLLSLALIASLCGAAGCGSTEKKDNNNPPPTNNGQDGKNENNNSGKSDAKNGHGQSGNSGNSGNKVVRDNPNRPKWTRETTYATNSDFVGVGRGIAGTREEAKDRAVARASAELARLKEVRIQAIARVYGETHTEDDNQALYEQTREIINAESSQTLRNTSVLPDVHVEKNSGGDYIVFAQVSIEKDKLFPQKRLERVFKSSQGSRERVKAYLDLAQQYELEGFMSNADAAYRAVVTMPGSKAEDVLAAVRFFYNKRNDYEESARYLEAIKDDVEKLPANNETRQSWTRLSKLIRERIPSSDGSVEKMRSLAQNKKNSQLFETKLSQVTRKSDGSVTIPVVLSVRGTPRRVLALWVDKDDFSIFDIGGGTRPFKGVRVLDVILDGNSKGGELLVFSLAEDSDVWDAVKRLQGRVVSRSSKASRDDRLRLWSLSQRLRKALDPAARSPGASSMLTLSP